MKIEKNKVVSIAYELKTTDDAGKKKTIEKVDKDHPMVFLFGSSGLPEKFENSLDGMKEGDKFDFVVESDEAYGEIEKEAIVKIPVETFKVEGKFDAASFPVGKLVPMSDQDGNMLRGKVLEVTSDAIKM